MKILGVKLLADKQLDAYHLDNNLSKLC